MKTSKAALDAKLEGVSREDMAKRAALISKTYRDGGGSGTIKSETDALAYALVRMPATYAALSASLNALVAVRPGGAVAGHRADDQVRIRLAKVGGGESEPVDRARAQVVEEHVRAGNQLRQHSPTAFVLQVDGDRFLAAVEPDEVARHAVDRVRSRCWP